MNSIDNFTDKPIIANELTSLHSELVDLQHYVARLESEIRRTADYDLNRRLDELQQRQAARASELSYVSDVFN